MEILIIPVVYVVIMDLISPDHYEGPRPPYFPGA